MVDVGDTLFLAGEFTEMFNDDGDRITRTHIAAIDAVTGEPTDFAPAVDGKVFDVSVSPDQETLYIGGAFHRVNDKPRKRMAAFDLSTGALTSFRPVEPNASLRVIADDGTHLYIGGLFTKIGSATRNYIARYHLGTGNLDDTWTPSADDNVKDLIIDDDRVWVGGDFNKWDGQRGKGFAALNLTNGALIPTDHAPYPVIDLAAYDDQIFAAIGGPGGRGAAYDRTTGSEQWTTVSDGNFQGVDAIGDSVYFGGHYENIEINPGARNRTLVGSITRHDRTTGILDRAFLPYVNGTRRVNTVIATPSYLAIGGDHSRVARGNHKGYALFPGSTSFPGSTRPAAESEPTRPNAQEGNGTTVEGDPTVTVIEGVGHLDTSWTAVPGATLYQFRYQPAGADRVWDPPTTDMSRILTGLTTGLSYTIKVRAYTGTWGPFTTVTAVPAAGEPTPAGPSISLDPVDVTVIEGSAASFTAETSSVVEPTLQWRRDGVTVPGETGATLTLATVALSDSGATFDVVATNNQGSTTSATATLTVEQTTRITVEGDPTVTVIEREGQIDTSWSAVAGATLYQFRYQPTGATRVWDPPTTNMSRVLTGLTAGLSHKIQVRAYTGTWGPFTTVNASST